MKSVLETVIVLGVLWAVWNKHYWTYACRAEVKSAGLFFRETVVDTPAGQLWRRYSGDVEREMEVGWYGKTISALEHEEFIEAEYFMV